MRDKTEITKYRQIVKSFLKRIKTGHLSKGDQLPSLSSLSKELSVSKETVIKAYKVLKEMNVLGSSQGKAYYIKNDYLDYDKRVFVLFDVLQTPYREILYKGIIENINNRIYLDFYFHNFNPDMFRKIIKENINNYDYYVVMPFPDPVVLETLKSIDQETLLLLDIYVDYEGKRCSTITQDHNIGLEEALIDGIDLISKYSEMIFIFPEDEYHPMVIMKDAVKRFCTKNKIKCNIIGKINEDIIEEGILYFIIEDEDLVNIIKTAKRRDFIIGKDIGILSLNDKPLKEIVENGITTISTDFYEMGKRVAHQIINNEKINIVLPMKLIKRNTL